MSLTTEQTLSLSKRRSARMASAAALVLNQLPCFMLFWAP